MKNIVTLFIMTVMLFFCSQPIIFSQEEVKIDTSWKKGGAIGLDLSQLALINPRIGGGQNKLSFGGLNTLFANFKEGKQIWDNEINLQLALQRLGDSENPFTKSIDLLRLNSKYGYAFTEKLYASLNANFETLLLNTYSDLSLSSHGDNSLTSKFLSPATILVAPGIDYVMDDNLSFSLSVFAYKSTLVMDDNLAALGVHGNPWNSNVDYENVKHELGTNFKALYKHTFFEKLNYKGDLNLFYNYLADEHGPEFVDVVFINDFGVEIFKGFSLNLLLDLRWDRDIASFLGDDVLPDGVEEFKKWMITEAFVVKYNYTF